MTQQEWYYHLLEHEGRQRIEEGCDKKQIQAIFSRVSANSSAIDILSALETMADLDISPEFPYSEPNDWADILAESPGLRAVDEALHASKIPNLDDKMKGAWLGRCAGCALGKPVERGPYMLGDGDIPGWQAMRIYLRAASAWPLVNYIPDIGLVAGKYDVGCINSTYGNISFMETDDDIRYTVIGTMMLRSRGLGVTTAFVADYWLATLPIGYTFTAERAAYRNLVELVDQGDITDKIPWIRTHLNPYREWIGAQIRADGWAYGAAGRPALAAELGYRDASLTHVKNGIYGEMLMAATVSAAFTSESPLKALQRGLTCIPENSRLAKDTADAIDLGLSVTNLDDLHGQLWKKWGRYHGVHTINNAALVAAAVAYGSDDYEKTIVAAVTGGWDTDCNGATAGSIWGASYGYDALPAKWIAPLNDRLYSNIPDFHPIAISECAALSAKIARELE